MPKYRSPESRISGVRYSDRIDPATDPYAIPPGGGRLPDSPDPAKVLKVNRRHVAMSEGQVEFVSERLNDAIAFARQKNLAIVGDHFSVMTVNLDERDQPGNFAWPAVREWLIEAGLSLEGPPLEQVKPEDTPEAVEARRSVRVHRCDREPPHISLGNDFDVWAFVESSETSIKGDPPTIRQSLEIVFASRNTLAATIEAHRRNQTGKRSFQVREVDLNQVPKDSPYRRFLATLGKKREPAELVAG